MKITVDMQKDALHDVQVAHAFRNLAAEVADVPEVCPHCLTPTQVEALARLEAEVERIGEWVDRMRSW